MVNKLGTEIATKLFFNFASYHKEFKTCIFMEEPMSYLCFLGYLFINLKVLRKTS